MVEFIDQIVEHGLCIKPIHRFNLEFHIHILLVREEVAELVTKSQRIPLSRAKTAALFGRQIFRLHIDSTSTVKRLVMRQNQISVTRHAHIDFKTTRSGIITPPESLHRIFIELETAAPMRQKLKRSVSCILSAKLGHRRNRQEQSENFIKNTGLHC